MDNAISGIKENLEGIICYWDIYSISIASLIYMLVFHVDYFTWNEFQPFCRLPIFIVLIYSIPTLFTKTVFGWGE